jgi:hypothetical protein
MLESLENRDEACYMVPEIVESILVEKAASISKLDYIRRAVTQAHPTIAFEDAINLCQLMLDPSMSRYFHGAKFAAHDESYLPVAAESTAKQLRGIMSYVATSGLVFSHSDLESTIERLLKISQLCDINAWMSFIESKQIPISTIRNDLETGLATKLEVYIIELHRESLLIKIGQLEKLLKRSITQSAVKDYVYDASRLRALDKLRHDLAHQSKKDYTIEEAQSDITYLYNTAFHFLVLTVERYDLQGQWRPATDFATNTDMQG